MRDPRDDREARPARVIVSSDTPTVRRCLHELVPGVGRVAELELVDDVDVVARGIAGSPAPVPASVPDLRRSV